MTSDSTRTPPPPPSPVKPRKPPRLICLKEVAPKVSLGKATIYRLLDESKRTGEVLFPIPVEVSKGRIGWHESEVDEWIASRPPASSLGDGVTAGTSHPAAILPFGYGSRRLISLREVIARTSIARAGIYRTLAEMRETGQQLFPIPVQVSKGRIAWHEHEIDAWIASRPRPAHRPPQQPLDGPADR